MREVLNAVLKRELTIIEYLYKNRGLHTIDEIIELTGVTEKTIRTDIKRINRNFPLLRIERELKTHVRLVCSGKIGLEYVYRKIMESSVDFTFFEYLLIEPNHSIKHYEEHLFISESFIRQLVRRWNTTFHKKGFNISISTAQKVKIEGDELQLRQLYAQYLIEKYGGDFQHNFQSISSTWKLMGYIGEVLSIDLCYSRKLRLSYWLFVCIQRLKHGYRIDQEASRNNETIQLLYDNISRNVVFLKQFMYDYQIGFSMEVLSESLKVFDDYFFVLKHGKNNQEEDISKADLKSFLQSLYLAIGCEGLLSERIIWTIYSFLKSQFRVTFFCYNYYGEFKECVKKESPLFLKMFEIHLEQSDLPSYMKTDEGLKERLLYHVVVHSKLLLEKLPKSNGRKKLLILTTFHNNYEDLLIEKLENRFSENVHISRYQSDDLHFDLEYIKQFDLILTNYDHIPENLKNRTLCLDTGISMRVIEKIKKKLAL